MDSSVDSLVSQYNFDVHVPVVDLDAATSSVDGREPHVAHPQRRLKPAERRPATSPSCWA